MRESSARGPYEPLRLQQRMAGQAVEEPFRVAFRLDSAWAARAGWASAPIGIGKPSPSFSPSPAGRPRREPTGKRGTNSHYRIMPHIYTFAISCVQPTGVLSFGVGGSAGTGKAGHAPRDGPGRSGRGRQPHRSWGPLSLCCLAPAWEDGSDAPIYSKQTAQF